MQVQLFKSKRVIAKTKRMKEELQPIRFEINLFFGLLTKICRIDKKYKERAHRENVSLSTGSTSALAKAVYQNVFLFINRKISKRDVKRARICFYLKALRAFAFADRVVVRALVRDIFLQHVVRKSALFFCM